MDQDSGNIAEAKTTCACNHPTHFLGRCQVEINSSDKLCTACMKDHFTRNDDPTIIIE
ncbi:MAG TPA: hypothetical protein VHM64_10985 [Candidatus Binatia bacterium]|nr:hypothetical protein [Candidatus Binatia bacterium]